VIVMSNRCELCGKGGMTGNRVSHSNRKSKRVTRANVQKVRALVDGRPQRLRVCTRCIRSGAVAKPA
jgi:large subunit ribosomal protein L28